GDTLAEFDIRSAARHVCGYRDGATLTRARNDGGFPFVMPRIQDLMGQILKAPAQSFGLLDAGSAEQDRLAALVRFADFNDNSVLLVKSRLKHNIRVIDPYHGPIRRNHLNIESIDAAEFFRLSGSGAGHSA